MKQFMLKRGLTLVCSLTMLLSTSSVGNACWFLGGFHGCGYHGGGYHGGGVGYYGPRHCYPARRPCYPAYRPCYSSFRPFGCYPVGLRTFRGQRGPCRTICSPCGPSQYAPGFCAPMARVESPASSSEGRQPPSASGTGTANPTFVPNGTDDDWKKRKEAEPKRPPAANGDLEAPKPAANENSDEAENPDLFEARKVQKVPSPTLIAPRNKKNDGKTGAASDTEKSGKTGETKSDTNSKAKSDDASKNKGATNSKSEKDNDASKSGTTNNKPVKSEKPPTALKEADQQNTWRSAPMRSRLVLHARYRSLRVVRRTTSVNRGWTPVRATAQLVSK